MTIKKRAETNPCPFYLPKEKIKLLDNNLT